MKLYFWPTVNGKKVAILLYECATPFTFVPVNIQRGDQLHADYLRICPNGRMPALVDDAPADAGAPMELFESGAIMMYLAGKAGRFWPQGTRAKYEVMQWVLWQNANQGPKLGEHNHFRRAAADSGNGDLGYALRRFDAEAHRLYGVLNLGLYRKDWLAAGEYTIADMACYPWASTWAQRGIDIEEFPNVKRWLARLAERPAVAKAMALGPEFREDPASIPPEEQARRTALLGFQRAQPIPATWA